MAQFRAKKLDLGCFINARVLRDHTKRMVFEKHEVERCVCVVFGVTVTVTATATAQTDGRTDGRMDG